MINFYKARSLLYRRQILQLNIRWKALDEIYKIYMRLHRSDLNISANCVNFLIFWNSFPKKRFLTYFSSVFVEYPLWEMKREHCTVLGKASNAP